MTRIELPSNYCDRLNVVSFYSLILGSFDSLNVVSFYDLILGSYIVKVIFSLPEYSTTLRSCVICFNVVHCFDNIITIYILINF